ncbi:hypothetical protein BDW22DRAFT_1349647, partial [Trametopsis cervina]
MTVASTGADYRVIYCRLRLAMHMGIEASRVNHLRASDAHGFRPDHLLHPPPDIAATTSTAPRLRLLPAHTLCTPSVSSTHQLYSKYSISAVPGKNHSGRHKHMAVVTTSVHHLYHSYVSMLALLACLRHPRYTVLGHKVARDALQLRACR